MARASHTRLLSHIDCPGGGQVWVDGTTLYVAHMRPPAGTSIFDIADPPDPACSPPSRCRPAGTRTKCGRRTAS